MKPGSLKAPRFDAFRSKAIAGTSRRSKLKGERERESVGTCVRRCFAWRVDLRYTVGTLPKVTEGNRDESSSFWKATALIASLLRGPSPAPNVSSFDLAEVVVPSLPLPPTHCITDGG